MNRFDDIPTRNLTKEKEERERRNAERKALWEAERRQREEEEEDEDLIDLEDLEQRNCIPNIHGDYDLGVNNTPHFNERWAREQVKSNDNNDFASIALALEAKGGKAGRHLPDDCKVDVAQAEQRKANKELEDEAQTSLRIAMSQKKADDDFDKAFPAIAKARKQRQSNKP